MVSGKKGEKTTKPEPKKIYILNPYLIKAQNKALDG